MKISSLGVLVTLGRSPGAEITEEAPGGLADLAGIHLGDVINAVDGKSVKSPAELQAELAGKTVGDKVRLGF
jgi:S1-C subfamily serine protease